MRLCVRKLRATWGLISRLESSESLVLPTEIAGYHALEKLYGILFVFVMEWVVLVLSANAGEVFFPRSSCIRPLTSVTGPFYFFRSIAQREALSYYSGIQWTVLYQPGWLVFMEAYNSWALLNVDFANATSLPLLELSLYWKESHNVGLEHTTLGLRFPCPTDWRSRPILTVRLPNGIQCAY